MTEKYSHMTGMTLLTAEEHRTLLTDAGFTSVEVFENHDEGWIGALSVRSAEPALH